MEDLVGFESHSPDVAKPRLGKRRKESTMRMLFRSRGMVIISIFLGLFIGSYLILDSIPLFQTLFWKIVLSVGGRALSLLMIKVGCPIGVALSIGFLVRGIFNNENAPFLGNWMDADSGPSTSFPKLEWELALDLPDQQIAPECLVCHMKQELRYLFNIGKKVAVSETQFTRWVDPLALDKATVGFSKALLQRVNALKLEHYNKGNHIPFQFSTKEGKERLYSIVWEYAERVPPE